MRSLPPAPRPRRRYRASTAALVALLVAVPILEVWLLIQVGQRIGVLPTVGILVVEAVLGAWLMRREGHRAYAALTGAFGTGRMPTREVVDAALVLVGGVLLMLPGFATDVVGFCCLLPFTRSWARKVLGYLVGRRISRLADVSLLPIRPGDVIPGETEPPEPGPRTTGAHVAEIDPHRH